MTNIVLLDGSIGQELVKRTGDRATPLWSTQVMMDTPDAVGAVHADYFAAGATVASTNTYAVHRSRLDRVGLDDQLLPLLDIALAQANAARDAHGSGRIAGCLGPLLASYRPDLHPDVTLAKLRFGEVAAHMAPHVDLLLIETVSSLQEGEGALSGVMGHGKPVWIAFTVMDTDGTRLRSGEPLQDILPLIARHKPHAVLINCSKPEAIAAGLPTLAQTGLPFGAYGNGFVEISQEFLKDAPTVDTLRQRQDLTPDTYADIAMSWVKHGATIIGGCCEVGPEHIAELARRLRAAGHVLI
jgi:S-methylmethionine-dependent homocysteine/selenocysteine methylase